MARSAVVKNSLMAVLGLAVGAGFLWLALRKVDVAELRATVASLDTSLMLFSTALYWMALSLRVLRWQLLLRELGPAPLPAVAETLVVGYAVNNVLPARLGEVARAAYAKRRLGIGRARVFGSIVIERVLDLVAILACLGGGLAVLYYGDHAARQPTFELVALNAGVIIGVAVLALAVLRAGNLGRLRIPPQVMNLCHDFAAGVASLNRRSALLAVVLSAIIWSFEVAALVQAFRALAVHLELGQAMLVMGIASLSTLVPTAPGYLGTYQLVFAIAMRAFNLPESTGIVAAGAVQACLFGSVTVVGAAILALRSLRKVFAGHGSVKIA
ncbi:MAG: flippase-like domain-containing protein [Gammaproteobacteria bacterium]|nr:flippase-like domain-containing protein [Gammaproteobacteria bacterium]